MRHAPLLSTLSCAFFHASHAFEFTGPDSSETLDLTQPITITWNANTGSFLEPDARALDLWFYALTSDDSGRFGWELDKNLSLSAGSYKCNPDEVVESINKTGASISPDAVHAFEARLMNNSGGWLSALESDKYTVEGSDLIRNSAGKGAQVGIYTAAVAFTLASLVIL
ncbi:hypothetical protein H9Q72_011416 [Fusarium xylarioides]|uniref:Uncharacterized protein n=1 Tax=Fusarium xylarioides TaxID=221167 RepID=A0A9P7LMT9_9HYPO|nr:hypothetical protein H9Q70_012514 [Fusarium xylarioides]KAG5760477.1 hypothetical protein H9Q72_011416 [Fusarium xylarioides]KAG5772477.1 hypothetical protein H9Q73_012457 [Fusarium xylarioides]KAG5818146.1 hypothetical protein H9Q74_010202 [Fusarium xylarioides]KAG5818400.1 hypothetical protein H9Q71_001460 [Fusarium xylarioides]